MSITAEEIKAAFARNPGHGWRRVKEIMMYRGKNVYTLLPPAGDARENWAAVWERVPVYHPLTNEIVTYYLCPSWFLREIGK